MGNPKKVSMIPITKIRTNGTMVRSAGLAFTTPRNGVKGRAKVTMKLAKMTVAFVVIHLKRAAHQPTTMTKMTGSKAWMRVSNMEKAVVERSVYAS